MKAREEKELTTENTEGTESKIKSLFRKNHIKVDDVRLEFAFECGGVKYFEPTDLNLFPWQRMLAATQAYAKMSIGLKAEEEIRKSGSLKALRFSFGCARTVYLAVRFPADIPLCIHKD